MSKLKVSNVYKSFAGKPVLQDLSFSINDGEFVSLLGPSGSGKSTLFHLIGGMYQPDKGSFFLNEEEITGDKGVISYMPQSPSLFPWRTVLSNVVLGAEVHHKVDLDKAREMLKKAGLANYEQAYPHELSGGMRQRVAFVRALLSPQDFLCLDEPFSALDEFTRLDMQTWLLDIWEQNRKSILFITHSIEEALYLSDRIIVLSSHPAKIKQIFELPFQRPRNQDLLLSSDFFEWKRTIYQELEQLKEKS